jgi:uncharacterized protein YndB with AHSA1/START domain
METNKITTSRADCEIVTARVFNIPRETAFRAWTEPEILQEWWGPKGFSNTFHEFDFRPGGKWIFTMQGPDMTNYPNESIFKKIKTPALISWDHVSGPYFTAEITFEEISEKDTRVSFKMIFETPEECRKIKGFAVRKNEENFDKLEQIYTGMASDIK